MDNPMLTDYVHIMYTLFDLFMQWQAQTMAPKVGSPFTYTDKAMIVFFTIMQFRRIFRFKAQRRWLEAHHTDVVSPGMGLAASSHNAFTAL